MKKYAELGFTTFDMADIYGPAEDIFGSFVNVVFIWIIFISSPFVLKLL